MFTSRTSSFAALFTGVFSAVAALGAQPPVALGTAGGYAVLAGSTITNTGSSTVSGDLGLSPGTAVTGFPPGVVNGTVRVAAAAASPLADLGTAYTDAAGRLPVTSVATQLGGQTLPPGVYNSASGTFDITGNLTLDGQNDPNAVFIFKTATTLITAAGAPGTPGSKVLLINGAQACNIFWQVGSSATLGTYSLFNGTVMALASITLNTGAAVNGRILARNGAVTLDTNVVTSSVCAGSIQIVKNSIGGDGTFGFSSNFGVGSLTTVGGTATQTINGLTPGAAFNVSENAAAGWTQTGALCTNGTPLAVVVVSGVTTVCTFTNTVLAASLPGSIQIVKNTVGGNGTFTFTSNFGLTTLTTAGGTATQTFPGLIAGAAFNFSETANAAWTQTSAVCTNGTPAAVIVVSGATTICTVTNTAVGVPPPATGSIQVVKNTVGGNGTFTFISNFGLTTMTTAGGTATQTFSGLIAGAAFNFSETATAGWTQTTAVCTNGSPAAVIVVGGVTTICTVTNTVVGVPPPATGSIQVVKNALGGNGTFTFTSNFGLTTMTTAGGTATQTFPGLTVSAAYNFTETASAGWTQTSVVCTNGTPAAVVVVGGVTTICTVTNTAVGVPPPATGSIQVVKNALGGNGTFTFISNFGLTTLTTSGGTATQTFPGLTAGTVFSLVETASAAWTQTSAVCTNGTPAAIVVASGMTTVCTITNTLNPTPPPAATGAIQVIKNSIGGNGTFAFTSNFGLSSLTTISGTANQTFAGLAPGGSFSVSESAAAGWTQTSVVCTNGSPAGIVVASGSTTVCTFTNTATVAPLFPDLTIQKTHAGNFRQGDAAGTYTITVTNSGQAPTSGLVAVSDTLPAGLKPISMSGPGWTCTPGATNCSRSDVLPAGASYPPITVTVSVATDFAAFGQGAGGMTAGDVFVSMADGTVQWRRRDWTLVKVLPGASNGQAKGMAFDARGNLYVTHWYGTGLSGNNVEKFDAQGNFLGLFGSGYNCNPSAIAFDNSGSAFVGQADCAMQILKFNAGGAASGAFTAGIESRGTYDLALDADQCTMFYTSEGPDVKRFDVCANAQLPNFNTAPLPDPVAGAVALLASGGLLVANSSVIARLDSTGALLRTYDSPGNNCWLGVVLDPDGTSFWASDWCASSVAHFDLATGTVLATHVVDSGAYLVKRITVRPNIFEATVTNIATVAGGGEVNFTNNSASDQTIVNPPLAIAALMSTVNAATAVPGAVAGSIASIYGGGLAAGVAAALTTPLPSTLAGTSVQIAGQSSALFFASPSQLNLQVPWEAAGQSLVSMVVKAASGNHTQTVRLTPFAPGIFTANAAGSGQAMALIAGTTLLAAPASATSLPAAPGGYVSFYATGFGAVSNQPATGAAASSSPLSFTLSTVTAKVGNVVAPVTFAGLAPGLVGVYQINVQIPVGVTAGAAVPVVLTIGGVASNTATIAVQ